MKTLFLTIVLTLAFVSTFSQKLNYELRGTYVNGIRKDKLKEAGFVQELLPYATGPWLMTYVATELIVRCDGNTIIAKGFCDSLSSEQKSMLQNVEQGSEIELNIQFRYNKNLIPDLVYNDRVHYTATVVPDTEAQFAEGYAEMIKYIEANTLIKISETIEQNFEKAIVRFTVNEQGEITNTKITETSFNTAVDQLLLEAINNMPKWKPAQNSNGLKIKQEMEFRIGTGIQPRGC